jgi:hypothetical protein
MTVLIADTNSYLGHALLRHFITGEVGEKFAGLIDYVLAVQLNAGVVAVAIGTVVDIKVKSRHLRTTFVFDGVKSFRFGIRSRDQVTISEEGPPRAASPPLRLYRSGGGAVCPAGVIGKNTISSAT